MKLSFSDFDIMFHMIRSIDIVNFESKDLIDLFSKIKINTAIMKAPNSVICDFTGKIVENSDLDSISIEFFKFRNPGLYGFAGLRKVYVSSSRIEELKDEIDDDGKVMFDLYFVRLILHEITNVLIRINKDNMNVSSRFITVANLEKYNVK
ncbi:unnamed protein product [Brachionus calyciflorus]|uniref:Uncharacterized protein n=1 Tax=Brachionus calyciflorus TaxID=104777 RepID=A0A814NIL1_9BILA|nr:unnamed protein product [Brachionus calyciflorus]